MNQSSHISFGRMAELVDAHALGACGVTHQSSTLCSPTNSYRLVHTVDPELTVLVCVTVRMKRCKVRCINCNTLHWRKKNGGYSKTFKPINSLRIDRQNVLFCNTAINKPLIYTFFKVLLLAILQVVLQQMQHIQCNVSVLQLKTRRCSHYVR